MKEKKERKNFYHWHWGWIDPYWFSVMVGRWFGLTRIVLSRDFFYFFLLLRVATTWSLVSVVVGTP